MFVYGRVLSGDKPKCLDPVGARSGDPCEDKLLNSEVNGNTNLMFGVGEVGTGSHVA